MAHGDALSRPATPSAPPANPRPHPTANPPARPSATKSRLEIRLTPAAPKRKAPIVKGASATDAPMCFTASGAHAVTSVDAVSVHAQHPHSAYTSRDSTIVELEVRQP